MRTSSSPSLLALLPIDRSAAAPLQRQIYDGVRLAILRGRLRPGERVPATRVLARELGVSRLTVLASYDQLLHEGYLEGRVGSGTFVSHALPDDGLRAAPSRGRARGADRATAAPRRAPPKERDEGGHRPFRLSLPALDRFPHVQWGRLVARHARTMTRAHMGYGDPAGLGTLRLAVADHLRTARAVDCEAEQVLIVPGSQAGLRLCAALVCAPGDRVAVEEPGYRGAQVAIAATGATLVPVPVDQEGIDVVALEQRAARGGAIRAVYVTPSHQYPLGPSMSAARRLALIDWARRHDAWIVEDDYDSEYRFVSRPLGALQGMDRNGRVLYVGTFSKVLFPALRVGYLVVPPALLERAVVAREAMDLFPPTLYQLALADFLREGHFVRHLRRMHTLYVRRRQALLDGLERHCHGLVEVHNADAGLHLSTLLPRGVSDVEVVRRMAEQRLTATALSTCYLGGDRRNGLLLGFGGFSERTLVHGTATLAGVLRSIR